MTCQGVRSNILTLVRISERFCFFGEMDEKPKEIKVAIKIFARNISNFIKGACLKACTDLQRLLPVINSILTRGLTIVCPAAIVIHRRIWEWGMHNKHNQNFSGPVDAGPHSGPYTRSPTVD